MSQQHSHKKPYQRPAISSMPLERVLAQIGPAQASVYVFDPAPVHPIAPIGGGSGDTMSRG